MAVEHLRTVEKDTRIVSMGLFSGKNVSACIGRAHMDFPGIVVVDDTTKTNRMVIVSPGTARGHDFSTNLHWGDYRIKMVEHLLAALWVKRINKVLISVDGDEIPIMDGSAKSWVNLLDCAQVHTEYKTAPYEFWPNGLPHLIVDDTIQVEDGDSYLRYTPHPYRFSVDISVNHPCKTIGYQRHTADLHPLHFWEEIMAARTFCHVDQAISLKLQGYALGNTLDNTVLFSEKGIINKSGLLFPDEYVRHEVLDLVGDLYILGLPLLGHIEGHNPNHRLNVQLAQKLAERLTTLSLWEEKWI